MNLKLARDLSEKTCQGLSDRIRGERLGAKTFDTESFPRISVEIDVGKDRNPLAFG